MAYTVANEELKSPFEWLTEEPWTWLVDYSDDDEYNILDDMYKVIVGEMSVRTYNKMYDSKHSLKSIKAEYNKRFPMMMADAMIAIANDIKDGKVIIKQKFYHE